MALSSRAIAVSANIVGGDTVLTVTNNSGANVAIRIGQKVLAEAPVRKSGPIAAIEAYPSVSTAAGFVNDGIYTNEAQQATTGTGTGAAVSFTLDSEAGPPLVENIEVTNAGTGHLVGDILHFVGATDATAVRMRVTAVA